MTEAIPDQESFEQWKEHPITKFVFQRLKAQAQETAQAVQDHLWASSAGESTSWQQMQAGVAHQRGQVEGVISVIELQYADLLTPEEIEAMTEKSE